MIYLDAMIFIKAVIDKRELGENCKKIIDFITKEKFIAATSILTLDEVVWILKRETTYKEAINYVKEIINSKIKILDVNKKDFIKSLDLMEQELKSRDSIHAAICSNNGIFSILTEDSDFKKVKELETFTAKEFLKKFKA